MSNLPKQSSAIEDPPPSVQPTKRWISITLATALVVVVVVWMGSGMLGSKPDTLEPTDRLEQALAPIRVLVEPLLYENVSRQIRVTGKTAPNRSVQLRAAVRGTIISLEAKKGDYVQKDQLLARLDVSERQSQVAQAKSLFDQQQLGYQSVQKLADKGLASQLELRQAKTQLESAKTQLAFARQAVSDTRITAPFDALIISQNVELGDYLSPGNPLFVLADVRPTLIKASFTERDLQGLGKQMPGAIVKLATGEVLRGRLSYVASSADSTNNTFAIEIALDSGQQVRLGVTANVELELTPVQAVKIDPVQLELDDHGEMGVKYVDQQNLVRFARVALVRTSETRLWVVSDQLQKTARLISVGAGFVHQDEKVNPVDRLERAAE